jgi:O-acetyl-ADP-ribose deacetylase (regulator of RNase III)
MQLHLVDTDPALVAAWKEFFNPFPEVVVHHDNILAVADNTVVSPANGFGFMDGGIDQVYRDVFGPQVEQRMQEAIARRPEGHLPVGASLLLRTGHSRIPFLIVAPTMLMPEPASGSDCYRAMRAVLRLADQNAELVRAIYCPGLATGVGRVSPAIAAEEMARAYSDWNEARNGCGGNFEG